MKERFSLKDRASCQVVRGQRNPSCDGFDPRGYWLVEHFRKGIKIGERKCRNLITNEGRNNLLEVHFHSGTQITTWYIGLINNSGSPTPALGNTYAAIRASGSANNWNELTVGAYKIGADAAIRGTWTPGAASSQTITNATPITFIITATGDGMTVYGLFLSGGHTDCEDQGDYSASGGVLWCATAFNGDPIPVQEDDELKVTYTVDANAS